jgi:hypothetical protein
MPKKPAKGTVRMSRLSPKMSKEEIELEEAVSRKDFQNGCRFN